MWPQIAGEQAQLQAIDQNPPRWTAAGKKAHAQSEQQVARGKARISELLGLVGNATKPLSLPLRLLAFYGPLDPLGFAGSQLSGIRFVGLTSGTR